MLNLNATLFDLKKIYVSLFIIFFSCCFAFGFDDTNRNILLVVFMFLSTCTFVFYKLVTKFDIWIFLFVSSILFFPVFVHESETRWSTVIYSCLFCTCFTVFLRAFVVSDFSRFDFLKLVKYLIYAYCITLVIQQLMVVVGLSPLNVRSYDPGNPFKLNSLGAEPSWSGRIIALLFYCYLTVKDYSITGKSSLKRSFEEDKWIWVAFFWSMISMISATAIVFLFIVLTKFVRISKILYVLPFVFGLLLVGEFTDFTPYERTKNIAVATITMDEDIIVQTDHSASFRIIPLLHMAKSIDVTTFSGLFGHGVDSISKNLDFGLGTGASASTLIALWYEYGFFSFLFFMILSLRLSVDVKNPTSIVFWFMLVFLYSINTQIPWLAMMLLYMTKHYSKYENIS